MTKDVYMEYKVITPNDKNYPKKLKERLSSNCPSKFYYSGPLEFLDRFTMAVISADSIGGLGLMAANQVLFTIREYTMNYIGAWHSVMETEIFRLGLFRKNTMVTLFSAKGLAVETFDSFLLDRFYPPMDKFPEREEYFRRAKNGELLILSVVDPNQKKQLRKNIIERNWVACNLADIVFVPYGVKGTKTYTVAKKIIEAKIPIFTTESEENKDLHKLGIPRFNRKSVKDFLEEKGAKLPVKESNTTVPTYEIKEHKILLTKKPLQTEIVFDKSRRRK